MATVILDLDNSILSRSMLEVKQDDTKDLDIVVYKDNREFDLTGYDVVINGVNSNGDGIVQTVGIEICEINHIKTILIKDFSAVPGEVKLEAVMTKGDIRITTFTFKMTVLKGLLKNANLKQTLVIDNIEILTNLIEEAKRFVK